jgi:5-formyltetrahydrofolate cyclo-ligase
MTKAELRKIYKEKRTRLTPGEIVKNNDLILINFQKINLPFISHLHTYISSPKLREPETSAIIRYLQFKNPGLTIMVPKINVTSGEMEHVHYHEETEFEDNVFGIPEPVSGMAFEPNEIDLVLIPLLAFDKHGFRVGYGKGHYDRFLSKCRDDIIKAGICFFEPVDEVEDIDQYDIPLNYCVTPQHVFEF